MFRKEADGRLPAKGGIEPSALPIVSYLAWIRRTLGAGVVTGVVIVMLYLPRPVVSTASAALPHNFPKVFEHSGVNTPSSPSSRRQEITGKSGLYTIAVRWAIQIVADHGSIILDRSTLSHSEMPLRNTLVLIDTLVQLLQLRGSGVIASWHSIQSGARLARAHQKGTHHGKT